MKKYIIAFAIILMISLAACSGQKDPSPAADHESDPRSDSITTLDEGVWPDNEYTEGLPVPPGTVAWAALDTEHSKCSVNLTGIRESDYNDYMEDLKQAGFSVIRSVSEQIKGEDYVSTGILLSNEEKGLSISYIPGGLTINISFVNN